MRDVPSIKKGGPRSVARLSAVQALYQLAMQEVPDGAAVVKEYIDHRLGKELEGAHYSEADEALFADVVIGTLERISLIDEAIKPCLNKAWSMARLEKIILAILRAGTYELMARPDVPTPVILNEYVDIAHAFFERKEANFVNGILDTLARQLRP